MNKPIKIEWLYYFMVLAEVKSFRQAARQLYMTQQSLSQNLLQLEKTLGKRLVERQHNFEKLTLAGNYVLKHAKSLLRDLQQLQEGLSESWLNETFELQIACNWRDQMLNQSLNYMLQTYPNIHFTLLHHLHTQEIEQALLQEKLDFGILLHPPFHLQLQYHVYNKSPWVIVSSMPQVADWSELVYLDYAEPEAQLEQTAPLHQQLDWPESLYPRKTSYQVDSLNMAVKLCESGLGALYVPRDKVFRQLHSGLLYEVAQAPFKRYIYSYLSWNPESALNKAAQCFLDYLSQQHYQDSESQA